jgi:UDP-N-acetylmuramate dehydrogenase
VSAAKAAAIAPTRRLLPEEQRRLAAEIQRRIGVRARTSEPLARYTTMRVGGPADVFVEVHNLFELRGIVRFARTRELPLFILGRGSNLVVSDAGVGGLVVLDRAQQARIEGERLRADSGLPMAKATTLAKDAGLSGLEFGLAIPGTVGGAVWANAGAHESDVRSVLVEAGVLRADGRDETLDSDGLGLAYRESALKHTAEGAPDVVLWATFRLTPAEPALVGSRLDEIRRWRQAHQPLGLPSAGSVFRNPPAESAGSIVERLGLKGRRVGGAVVSEKHANFIVNDRAGTAAQVRRLAEEIRRTVRDETGIELVFEIVFAGDWSGWSSEGTRPSAGVEAESGEAGAEQAG